MKFGSLESTVILFNFILLNVPQIFNRSQSRACFRSVVVITSASHAEGRRFKSCRKQNAFLRSLYLKLNDHNSRFLILKTATPCLFQPKNLQSCNLQRPLIICCQVEENALSFCPSGSVHRYLLNANCLNSATSLTWCLTMRQFRHRTPH